MGVALDVGERMMLSMDSDPLPGFDSRGNPDHRSEDVRYGGSQRQSAMGERTMQIDGRCKVCEKRCRYTREQPDDHSSHGLTVTRRPRLERSVSDPTSAKPKACECVLSSTSGKVWRVVLDHESHRVRGMCGRFTSLTPPDDLARMFEAEATSEIEGEEFHPNYNVAPSTRIFVVASSVSSGRKLGRMQWGLVPHWAKPPLGSGQINARSETIDEKPTFRDSYRKRRCIIPMSGYYEWRTVRDGELVDSGVVADSRVSGAREPKRAVYVTRADGQPFAVAGLWSTWTSRDDSVLDGSGRDGARQERERQRRTCCVVTRDANSMLASVHDRMPVVLEKEHWPVWLGEDMTVVESDVRALLESDPDSLDLRYVDVGPLVNSVRNNGPELIVPVR